MGVPTQTDGGVGGGGRGGERRGGGAAADPPGDGTCRAGLPHHLTALHRHGGTRTSEDVVVAVERRSRYVFTTRGLFSSKRFEGKSSFR